MKPSRSLCILLLLLTLLLSCRSTPGQAAESCALRGPPPDAGVTANHGSFFFVYPRAVGASYTGCQTMWDELGRRVFVFRFINGALKEYSLTDYYSGKVKSRVCKYKDERLAGTSSTDCPAYEDVKRGLTVTPEEEPPISKEKDLRQK